MQNIIGDTKPTMKTTDLRWVRLGPTHDVNHVPARQLVEQGGRALWFPGEVFRFAPPRFGAGVFPMESSTKTIAKRARVGSHTEILSTMKKEFPRLISSTSGLASDMIVSNNVSKLLM